MGLLSAERFKPTLFVGLGGNGGRIVSVMARKLRRHPSWPNIASMTHFLAIDTNKDDLDKLRDVPAEGRFLISAFDRPAYITRKRGKAELAPDPMVTTWAHPEYAFRASQGAGAGQIRVESRLGLYYTLENDARAGLRAQITRALHQATLRENPWRDHEDREFRILVYGSLAGGTGSGAFLPMAYLLRDAVRDLGGWRANIVGFLTLPTCFLDKVKPELHQDILANGYAGLKELEHLTRQLGYDGGSESLELHYDPGNPTRTTITERPFSLAYLIDRPEAVSIERYEHAVADASFLQIFSPLLGAQAGEYDNYDKHQKRLAAGGFSVHYAAFGASLLHFPRNDVIRYAAMKYAARAFRELLAFGADEPEFRVPYGDPAFERLDAAEKDRRVDEKFLAYVAWKARQEEDRDEVGLFRGVVAGTGTGGKSIRTALHERLTAIYARLDELIQIPDVERSSISPGSPSLERPLSVLRREAAAAQASVRQYLEGQLADLRAGRVIDRNFADLEVNPVARRHFLITLLRDALILPGGGEDEAWLGADVPRVDLESAVIQAEKTRLEAELQAAAAPGFLARLTDRDNAAFQGAKQRSIRLVDDLAQDAREDLRRTFWRTFEAELRRVAQQSLAAFRRTAEIAEESGRQLDAEAERFRRDPAAEPDSDVAQYYLDAEAMRDDRRSRRLWDVLWTHRLDTGTWFDPRAIFPLISEAFRKGDAGEITTALRASLLAQGKELFTRAVADLDLASALDLEQRYTALGEADIPGLRATGRLDAAVMSVPADAVERGVREKLARVYADCVLLAQIDRSKSDDPDVRPADVVYAGLAPAFDTDEAGSLGRSLRAAVSKVGLVEGWNDRDALVLYRALLGVPVYWFRSVEGRMQPAYRRAKADGKRGYPLHIDARWEDTLPDLDPIELRRADEQRAKEAVASRAREARMARVAAFAVAEWAGLVGESPAGWRWTLDGVSGALPGPRHAAFAAFEASSVRDDVAQEARRRLDGARADRRRTEDVAAELDALAGRLRAAYARAETERDDAELAFLREEREALTSMLRAP